MTIDIGVLEKTWNNGAVSFVGIGMDVTNTSSAEGSRLIKLEVGGTSVFDVALDGGITAGVSSGYTWVNAADHSINGNTVVKGQHAVLFENTRTSGFGADFTQYNVIAIKSSHGSCASGIMFLNHADGYETGAVGYAGSGTLVGFIDDAVYLNASPHYDTTGTRTRDTPSKIVIGQEGVVDGSLVYRQRIFIDTDYTIKIKDKHDRVIIEVGDDVLKFPNLPTSNPSVAGQMWNDGGTLKISAG